MKTTKQTILDALTISSLEVKIYYQDNVHFGTLSCYNSKFNQYIIYCSEGFDILFYLSAVDKIEIIDMIINITLYDNADNEVRFI